MPNLGQNETEDKFPDLSAYQQKMITNFENLEIGSFPSAELMLIFLGYKPATEVALAPWNDPPEKVVKTLRDSGLIAGIKNYKDVNGKKFAIVAVAKDKETMERLKKAEADADHEEYGRLMGYPDTAIDAFMHKEKLLPEVDYPEKNDKTLDFKLSKDHWQEEIKVIKKWSQAIKQYSPKIYELLNPKP